MRIAAITIDGEGLAAPSPDVEQERRVAIYDLLEENRFALPAHDAAGPFRVGLGIREGRLVFDIAAEDGAHVVAFHLSLGPFAQVIKDYAQICQSYLEAVQRLPAGQIEAIDMARRGIHDEGARVLLERLEGKAETDIVTARRLFTLICVLRQGLR